MTDPAWHGSVPPNTGAPYGSDEPASSDYGMPAQASAGYGPPSASAPYDPAASAYDPYDSPPSPPGCGAAAEQAPAGAQPSKPPGEPLGKGLFGSLFDRSFDNLVTTKLLRMLYTLAVLCVTGVNVVFFLFGWSLTAGSFWPFLGWVIVMGVPVMWLAEVVMVRVVVEYLIVQHKIATDLTIVREVVKEMRAAQR